MKLRFALLAAVGVALALYLVRYVGWHAVLSAAATIGWTGFALFCLGALALFVLLGAAWQVLLPAALAPRLRVLIGARLVRDATWTFDRVGPDGEKHSADAIHAMTLVNLNGEFARIVTASEAIAALKDGN